jgi:leucyl aminopeptidase (aminopeptidase T)
VVDARVERYAELLLDTCLGVQRGWQVLVWSTPWARPLLEEVMRQLGIRGAYPLLRLTFSGGLLYHRAWLAHAPLEVISKPASIDVYALEQCDAILSIAAPENTDDGAAAAGVGLGADIGAGRTRAVRRAYRPPGARLHRDDVPGVLCWFPTPALAQDAGMSLPAFQDFSLRVVPRRLGSRAQAHLTPRQPLRRG